jgi:hypothetical protein
MHRDWGAAAGIYGWGRGGLCGGNNTRRDVVISVVSVVSVVSINFEWGISQEMV